MQSRCFNYQHSVFGSLEISASKCRYFMRAYASAESWSCNTVPTSQSLHLPTDGVSPGQRSLPLLWMWHPWGWSWTSESDQESCAAFRDEALLQTCSPRGTALYPSYCILLCRDTLGCSAWLQCPVQSPAKHRGKEVLETAFSLYPSLLTAGPYWPRQLVDISSSPLRSLRSLFYTVRIAGCRRACHPCGQIVSPISHIPPVALGCSLACLRQVEGFAISRAGAGGGHRQGRQVEPPRAPGWSKLGIPLASWLLEELERLSVVPQAMCRCRSLETGTCCKPLETLQLEAAARHGAFRHRP